MRDCAISSRVVKLCGTPGQKGRLWGKLNGADILSDMRKWFIAPAAEAGIPENELVKKSSEFAVIAGKIAPHWLCEAEAAALEANVSPGLYIAFIAGVYRNLFLDECTSYAVPGSLTTRGEALFHKNRDNKPRRQSAYIMNPHCPGVHKFIATTDTSVAACMSMVNEKGLAGSADTGGIPPEKPSFRGVMNAFILRYIAEKAGNCGEALEIIRDFTGRGWAAMGGKTGTHWLFVDAAGRILEVSSNESNVNSRYHEDTVYFSARGGTPAAESLRSGKVDFQRFHGASRDESICFKGSISGMTVEIARVHPGSFTSCWITLPAAGPSFNLLMAGEATPVPLLDGTAYDMFSGISGRKTDWERAEKEEHERVRGLKLLLERFIEKKDYAGMARAADRHSAENCARTISLADGPRGAV